MTESQIGGNALANIQMRLGKSTDVPEMSRLLTQLGYSVEQAVLAERFEHYDRAGEAVIVAAERGADMVEQRLVGLATLHATPVLHRAGPVGRITALVVDPGMRRAGIGRALVTEAERWAAARNCVLIEVTSNKRRKDAHAFYERLGYECSSFRFAKPLSRQPNGSDQEKSDGESRTKPASR